MFYSGDTCSSANGEPCDVGEQVSFTVIRFPWFTCGARTFAWSFGDDAGELTTDTSTRHRFQRGQGRPPWTYNVQVTVTVEGRTVVLTKSVTVEEP